MKKDIISKRYFNDELSLIELNETQTKSLGCFLNDSRIKYKTIYECPLCKSTSFILIAKKDRYAIPLKTVICEKCGLIRSLNQFDGESSKIFYAEYYRNIYQPISDISAVEKQYETELKRDTPPNDGRVILEIGCGGGWNLMSFFREGYKHYGFDFDKEFIEYGRKKGLNLFVGGVKEAVQMGIKCDHLILSHVLEHTDNPVDFLSSLKPLLKEGALINIYVPSLGPLSQGHLAQNLLETLQNAHNFLFDDFTLRTTGESAGFEMMFCVPAMLILKHSENYKCDLLDLDTVKRGRQAIENIKSLEKSYFLKEDNMIFRTDRIIKEKVSEYFKKIISGEINPLLLNGAFGDIDDCTGIVEEQIFPEEGGAYLKLLGCNYLLKGCPMGMIYTPVLESLGLAKAIIMQSIKMISKSWFLKTILAFSWLFDRRNFYYFLNTFIHHIHGCTVGVKYFEEKRYNKFATEVRRAFKLALEKEIKTEKPLSSYTPDEAVKSNKLRILVPLMKFVEWAVFCIDFDTAYRCQSQDGLSNLDKTNDAVKELERILNIMANRYNDYVSEKIRAFAKFTPIIRFSPLLKRILTNFFQELDIEKVKLDEADWYFSLRRERYNFNGLTLEKRLEQAKRIDKEQGHARIKFYKTTKEQFDEIVKNQNINILKK